MPSKAEFLPTDGRTGSNQSYRQLAGVDRVPYHGCPPLQVHVPGSDDDLCPEAGRHRLCRVRTFGMTRWGGMCGAGPRALPWWTIPATVPRLRYVFDISDTGTREHSRTPWLWQLEEQHKGPVSAMLERSYGTSGDDLPQQIIDVAGKLAGAYWEDHRRDFFHIVDDSFPGGVR